jgi:hypothetical protein
MRDFYTGLLFECPLKMFNASCPFEKLRGVKNAEQRFEIWDAMPDKDIFTMIKQHKECYQLNAEICLKRD